ncbi:Uncharacterized protein GBIM_11949 [Gryllus bimaculatus]|nr:Uncharacterized protein GBIM_11949 [Gryllus bimaculatus]
MLGQYRTHDIPKGKLRLERDNEYGAERIIKLVASSYAESQMPFTNLPPLCFTPTVNRSRVIRSLVWLRQRRNFLASLRGTRASEWLPPWWSTLRLLRIRQSSAHPSQIWGPPKIMCSLRLNYQFVHCGISTLVSCAQLDELPELPAHDEERLQRAAQLLQQRLILRQWLGQHSLQHHYQRAPGYESCLKEAREICSFNSAVACVSLCAWRNRESAVDMGCADVTVMAFVL